MADGDICVCDMTTNFRSRIWRIVPRALVAAAAIAVVSVTAPPAFADEPVATVPETGQVDGATVAVGAPPVPPPVAVSDEPVVDVGAAPTPTTSSEGAALVAVGEPVAPVRVQSSTVSATVIVADAAAAVDAAAVALLLPG